MSSESGVLYTGITNDIVRRVEEHKNHTHKGFTDKYRCNTLVYYEHFTDINYAIYREKEIKKWRRDKKIALINSTNPTWNDLYNNFVN